MQPTVSYLQTHDRPPRPFLLDDGELPDLVPPLDVVRYEEGWIDEDRHVALMVARRAHAAG